MPWQMPSNGASPRRCGKFISLPWRLHHNCPTRIQACSEYMPPQANLYRPGSATITRKTSWPQHYNWVPRYSNWPSKTRVKIIQWQTGQITSITSSTGTYIKGPAFIEILNLWLGYKACMYSYPKRKATLNLVWCCCSFTEWSLTMAFLRNAFVLRPSLMASH